VKKPGEPVADKSQKELATRPMSQHHRHLFFPQSGARFLGIMTLSPTPKPGYLRPKDAATYLSVNMSTIYRLMSSKKLKSYKVGGARILKVSDIDALVESGVVE
jgi:excisionase family DNA binding protein